MNQITPGLLCNGTYSGITYFLLTVNKEEDGDGQQKCFGIATHCYHVSIATYMDNGIHASISTVHVIGQ